MNSIDPMEMYFTMVFGSEYRKYITFLSNEEKRFLMNSSAGVLEDFRVNFQSDMSKFNSRELDSVRREIHNWVSIRITRERYTQISVIQDLHDVPSELIIKVKPLYIIRSNPNEHYAGYRVAVIDSDLIEYHFNTTNIERIPVGWCSMKLRLNDFSKRTGRYFVDLLKVQDNGK
jgi:hypothetical protein